MSGENHSLTEAIDQLATSTGEPAWFTHIRHEALAAVNNYDLPYWDRTNPADYPLQLPPASWQNQLSYSQVGAALPPEVAAQGVVLCDIFAALSSHGDILQRHFGSVVLPREDKFTAMHYAALNYGMFLYVPRNVEVTVPVQIATPPGSAKQLTSAHTLVIAERGAQVQVVEVSNNTGINEQSAFLHVVEVVAGEGASVQYTSIQDLDENSSHYALRRSTHERDARVEWVLAAFGAALSKDNTEAILKGNGSEANSFMMFFANGKQHLDIGIAIEHEGQHTTSDILARGVADDKARGIYRAMTHIARGAKFTAAYQKENTLLLSKEARADAIPGLTIDEDEVQAGHAATVGQADEDQLFYLMSRGLSRNKAVRMVALGFVDPVLQRVPTPEVREELLQTIDRKMTV